MLTFCKFAISLVAGNTLPCTKAIYLCFFPHFYNCHNEYYANPFYSKVLHDFVEKFHNSNQITDHLFE